jgi:hypothetical protein
MQINDGDTANPPPPPDCAELNDKNTKLRSDLQKDPAKDTKEYFAGSSTVAHASFDAGPAAGAVSRLLVQRYDRRVVKGLWGSEAGRKKIEARTSNLCPDPEFKYDSGYRPHQSHCESKLLETLFDPAGTPPTGGSLLLNINWQIKGKPSSKLPCDACKKLLCHAQKECGLNIQLCKEDPADDPQPLSC